ncbi:hypothetical protein [Pseudobacteriovorax antillogorgiicola]|nr:hypothetical protein [Pseudobacteriovorax antillogorgiicola]
MKTMRRNQVIEYPELSHEIYNEPEKVKAFDDLKEWIAQNSKY